MIDSPYALKQTGNFYCKNIWEIEELNVILRRSSEGYIFSLKSRTMIMPHC